MDSNEDDDAKEADENRNVTRREEEKQTHFIFEDEAQSSGPVITEVPDEKDEMVIISCRNEKYEIPKSTLKKKSAYFNQVMEDNPDKSNITPIFLDNEDPHALKLVVAFLQKKEIEITDPDVLGKVLLLAEKLQIEELVHKCLLMHEEAHLTLTKLVGIVDEFGTSSTKENIANHLAEEFELTVLSSDMVSLTSDWFMSIVLSPNLKIVNKDIFIAAIMKWVLHRPKERDAYIGTLLTPITLTDQLFATLRNYCSNSPPNVVNQILSLQSMSSTPQSTLDVYRNVKDIKFRLIGYNIKIMGLFPDTHYTLHEYDGSKNAWSPPLQLPVKVRRGSTLLRNEKDLYVIAGPDNSSCVLKVNLNNYKKDKLPNLLVGRNDPASCYHQNQIFVAGGKKSFLSAEYYSSVERFDLNRSRWEEIAPLSEGRSYAKMVSDGENLYVVGGYDKDGQAPGMEKYNLATNQWSGILTPIGMNDYAFNLHVSDHLSLVFTNYEQQKTLTFNSETTEWSSDTMLLTQEHVVKELELPKSVNLTCVVPYHQADEHLQLEIIVYANGHMYFYSRREKKIMFSVMSKNFALKDDFTSGTTYMV